MKAIYHSDRGEKSALLLVRVPFVFGQTPVYVPRVDVAGMEFGDEIELPSNLVIVDMVDHETGEVRTVELESGEVVPLKTLAVQ